MNPYTQITKQNPNEIHGVRACIGAGQQRGYDCVGPWTTFLRVPVANGLAPHASICANCLAAAAKALAASPEVADLGYAGPPEDFRTPTVTEIAPPKPRAKRSPQKRELEELSL